MEERSPGEFTKEREKGEEEIRMFRRASIKRKDVETRGLTLGCRGCIAINRKTHGSKSIEHSDECRKRHEGQMRKQGDARMVQQDYRLIKKIEEEVEKISKKRKTQDEGASSSNQQGGTDQEGGSAASGDQPMTISTQRKNNAK